jgi:uncharacterized membrane protein YfcA
MWDAWWMLAAAVAVFGLAGVVKGVVGLGLPTVSMALLALFRRRPGCCCRPW